MINAFLFWFFTAIIGYTYLGYTAILLLVSVFARIRGRNKQQVVFYEPEISLIIPSFNEEECISEKIENTLSLNYPPEKIRILWITDGTTDNSHQILRKYPQITVLHENERRGKIHAMNRGMRHVNTPIVVFTDANSMLNREALHEIVQPFTDKSTGCVTGEKRISSALEQKAAGAGEGLYWKYESLIKRLESETGSVVGAVGEIFAIRSELYEEVNEDTLLDDFTLSLQMVQKGFAVKYAPRAMGTETSSLSVSEEMKRKIRIASGGIQSLIRMPDLLNPLRYGFLTFKYLSHKVFRWILVPFCFPLVFLFNVLIVVSPQNTVWYTTLLLLQCLFYFLALGGKIMENKGTRFAFLFAPYYLLTMNYAVLKGLFRYLSGNYSVKWQKVKRS